MVRQDPILIAAPPRSGTTLLAAILNAHGVWVGRGRTTRYPGTNMNFASENQDIKKIFKEVAEGRGYKNWNTPFPDFSPYPRLKDRIEEFVPEDTPWLVKTSWNLIFLKFWVNEYPEARWLFPIRDIEKIVDSMNRHPGMAKHPDSEKYDYVNALQRRRFEAITTDIKYHCFNIEKFVYREEGVIADVFCFLGIEPQWNVINKILEPTMLKR